MRFPLRHLRLAGPLALASLTLCAQNADDENIALTLEAFPVVGTRFVTLDPAARPDAIVLDRDDIDHSGALDLAELLQRLPQTYGGAGSGLATVPNGSPTYGDAATLFDFTTGSSSYLRQTGVSSVGLGGLGASGTLILIDGRRLPMATQEDTANDTGAGFYDLSSIPLGMVERVEVLAHGASALYGSDAVGGVVNVVLRRDYAGSELTLGVRTPEAGGAFARHATLSSGLARGRWRVRVALTAQSQNALKASQRAFSADQDRTAQGGRDWRLTVGHPAVIAADSGTLAGLTDAKGNPTRFALVPSGQAGETLTVADLTGVAGFTASGLRMFNTAETKDLIGASEQLGAQVSATYTVNPRLEAFASFMGSDRSSETANEPPAASGTVPADDPRNPLDQPVVVSLVLVEAPPRSQSVDVSLARATAGLRGTFADAWAWETAVTHSRENFESRTLDLDLDAFSAALADGRFNPFGAATTDGPINAHLNDELMRTARISGSSALTSFDVSARGPLLALPGGEASLVLGAEATRATRQRSSTDPLFGQPAEIESARSTSAAFTELYLPLIGGDFPSPALHRLGARLALRYERSDVFDQVSPSAGVYWQPWPALSFTADFSEGFRAPALTEFEDVVRTTSLTITDPQNQGETYSVTTRSGGNPQLQPETSRTYQLGATLKPPVIPGLRLRGSLQETYYEEKLTVLPAQTLINFASRFPGRVTRDATGRINQVDTTTLNFGEIYVRRADLSLSYDREYTSTGRFTLRIDASRQLDYCIEQRPDRDAADMPHGTDTISPPKWSGLASLTWQRGDWELTTMARHIAGFDSNNRGTYFDALTAYPSWTTLDLRLGHRFRNGLWRHWGRGARIQLGIGNLTDREPPFANTVYGYNQGLYSPLGRTYDVTLRLPF